MSVGVAPGLSIIKVDMSKLNFGTGADPVVDPVVGNTSTSLYRPDLAAGIWLYSSDLFFGISAQQLIPQSITFGSSTQASGSSVPHLFYTAGYKFFLNDEIALLPSFMAKQIPGTPTSIDFNCKGIYNDFLWVGATYRTTESFAFLLGINPTYYLNVSYSYDMVQRAFSVATSGTHEIVIGILLNNRYRLTCPKKLW